jgi:hypothetical protein
MSPIAHNLILTYLHKTLYSDEALRMYNILSSIPEDQTTVDLSAFTDTFVFNAEKAWNDDYNVHGDEQEGDIGASEFVAYNIENMLIVKNLFPNIINIIASNEFHNYVSDNWWSRRNETIYKIFTKIN